MRHPVLTLLVGFLFAVAMKGPAVALNQSEAFSAAQKRFEHGLLGSKKDNEQAAEQFKALSEQDRGNPLYLAYYGSAVTIRSRDAYMPWNKLKLGEQGLDIIHKALKMLGPEHETAMMRGVPISLETKLVAIRTFLDMPDKYFHHYDAGRNLLAETMKMRIFQTAPSHIQSRLLVQAALIAQKEHQIAEEARHLKRILELDPRGKDAEAARARLKELGL